MAAALRNGLQVGRLSSANWMAAWFTNPVYKIVWHAHYSST